MRYAVQVAYLQRRVIMVDAANEAIAARRAEDVARAWQNVTAARAEHIREAHLQEKCE